MMRGGVLLAEESPENLMTRCNTSTLEEAFLSLSYKQETSSNIQVRDVTTSIRFFNQLTAKRTYTCVFFLFKPCSNQKVPTRFV